MLRSVVGAAVAPVSDRSAVNGLPARSASSYADTTCGRDRPAAVDGRDTTCGRDTVTGFVFASRPGCPPRAEWTLPVVIEAVCQPSRYATSINDHGHDRGAVTVGFRDAQGPGRRGRRRVAGAAA
ncbi:hypothetical protein GCM10027610_102680 [Dactylosporangium cerinum]